MKHFRGKHSPTAISFLVSDKGGYYGCWQMLEIHSILVWADSQVMLYNLLYVH